MSAPNSSYDPVEVADLSEESVAAAVQAALAAVEAATLEALKDVRVAHTGDRRRPLALANREIGALPPQAKKEAGQRVGSARARVREAVEVRTTELERERDERVLVTEAVDVTLPYDQPPDRSPAPLDHHPGAHRRRVRRHGLGGRRGSPRSRPKWINFDALNLGPDHPARAMQDTFFVGSEAPAWCCAPTLHRPDPAP